MASFNQVILLGNLTRDIELRRTPGGSAVCEVGIATNRKYYSKAKDEQVEDVCFIDCTLFGKTAEVANEYLHKGSQVQFIGRLQLDTWQDKETGANRSKHKVVVSEMVMTGGRGEPKQQTPAEEFYNTPAVDTDDVPF